MGNKPFASQKKKAPKRKISYDLHNPYKEGWLWKQSRHLKKWRKRWVVIHSHFIYTFADRRIYDVPTEIINLHNFTYLSKESCFQEPSNIAQQKLAHLKRKFALSTNSREHSIDGEKEEMYLIILSDLNNDDSFVFKCTSRQSQSQWIYSLERALKYRSNLLQNVVPSAIIKYIVSLYFLSFERLKLSQISLYFEQLFGSTNYNSQYHYYHDAIYWSKHFGRFCKIKDDDFSHRNQDNKSLLFQLNMNNCEEEHKHKLSLEELQFNETSFYLSSNDWSKFTKNERLQLKYFFIFYHEFAALNYEKKQSDFSTFYIQRYPQRKTQLQNEESVIDDALIVEELNQLDLKYENIRLDGYEWNTFFNRWISYPFIKSLFVSCNIETLSIGSCNYYDESCSMMTQLANRSIDVKLENMRPKKGFENYIHNKYNKSTFWRNGGIQFVCDIIKYSRAFTSHLSTIRILSLRDSNFTDGHLKLLCDAINSRTYQSSKPLTLTKLILSDNFNLTDNTMKLLFTTIGNKLQYLEQLELNDMGITDKIALIMLEFYTNFHQNHNITQLHSIALFGNFFSFNGFKTMNRLFEDDIIDERRFRNGEHKKLHIGVNGQTANDTKSFGFDARLHIVVSGINGTAFRGL